MLSASFNAKDFDLLERVCCHVAKSWSRVDLRDELVSRLALRLVRQRVSPEGSIGGWMRANAEYEIHWMISREKKDRVNADRVAAALVEFDRYTPDPESVLLTGWRRHVEARILEDLAADPIASQVLTVAPRHERMQSATRAAQDQGIAYSSLRRRSSGARKQIEEKWRALLPDGYAAPVSPPVPHVDPQHVKRGQLCAKCKRPNRSRARVGCFRCLGQTRRKATQVTKSLALRSSLLVEEIHRHPRFAVLSRDYWGAHVRSGDIPSTLVRHNRVVLVEDLDRHLETVGDVSRPKFAATPEAVQPGERCRVCKFKNKTEAVGCPTCRERGRSGEIER